MQVMLVTISVKSDHIQEFIAATRLNQEASVREPGNVRFDFLQSADDPSHFMLYEAYDNDEAAIHHKQTSHYLRWRETVAPWMAVPRKGAPYRAMSSMKPWTDE